MELIPSSGITIESIFRGILGMTILLGLSYALSVNKKAIKWKTVFLGLLAQLVIAIGVLKIGWISDTFEFFGSFFIKILEYTEAGTSMLFGDFSDVEKTGYIFAFQVLPVIVFFSALTSIGYYFGIIQKTVKGLAWGLSKFLNITGAEASRLLEIFSLVKPKLHF